MLAIVLGCGCKAETLGVDLPLGGLQAISQEDLQRDVWAMQEHGVRSPGSPGSLAMAAHVERRLQQMHTLPAFGDSYRLPVGKDGWAVCGQRDGRSGKSLLVVALDPGVGAVAGALPAAAVITLAKATDRAVPTHTWIFCVLPEPGGVEAYRAQPAMPLQTTVEVNVIGPLDGSVLSKTEVQTWEGRPARRWTTGDDAVHGTQADGMERVDYREVAQRVAELYGALAEEP